MSKKTIIFTLLNAGIWWIIGSMLTWFIATWVVMTFWEKLWIEPLILPTMISFLSLILFLILIHLVSKEISKHVKENHTIISSVSTLIFVLFLLSLWINFLDLGISAALFFWISNSNINTKVKKDSEKIISEEPIS